MLTHTSNFSKTEINILIWLIKINYQKFNFFFFGPCSAILTMIADSQITHVKPLIFGTQYY